ncbi:hypothetical protein N8I77_004693 [Diaporthe amygdali]|uniref:Uncharacterized protein n=1 Tax=Phomopsis amygdali TaxID=1214568 RepID=A0AAD9SMJ6_PHOAM|nr:hypothetical protein N8I77_004693 [Diaporthe amygdali]
MDMAAYSRPPTPFPTQQEEEDREEDKEELEGEASSRMGRSGMAAWVWVRTRYQKRQQGPRRHVFKTRDESEISYISSEL